jgi:hypothetical protein
MAVDRLREKALGGLLIPMLGEQEIDDLACCIHGAMEVRPCAYCWG